MTTFSSTHGASGPWVGRWRSGDSDGRELPGPCGDGSTLAPDVTELVGLGAVGHRPQIGVGPDRLLDVMRVDSAMRRSSKSHTANWRRAAVPPANCLFFGATLAKEGFDAFRGRAP